MDLHAALHHLVHTGGSDLHLKVPSRPLVRTNGMLTPLPASDVARTESIRSRVAMFLRAGISDARSMDMDCKFYFRRSKSASAYAAAADGVPARARADSPARMRAASAR